MNNTQANVSREMQMPVTEHLEIFTCEEGHVHILASDKELNVLSELSCEPEDAYALAKRIEQAADHALGIA